MIDGLRQQLTDRELSETDTAKPPNYRMIIMSIPASLRPSLPPLETHAMKHFNVLSFKSIEDQPTKLYPNVVPLFHLIYWQLLPSAR